MKISVLTIFPRVFDSFLSESILGRAVRQSLLTVETVDIRAFSERKHKNTDDDPFGGGSGMVMLAQPIVDAMESVAPAGQNARRIFLSPRGAPWTQRRAMELSREPHVALLCGHYEGVDQRAIDLCVDEEISIGDYVVTGGETAALVVIDSIARLIPGVLGCADSPDDESFSRGLLEYPQYTRPRVFRGLSVPEVLLNGNHADIQAWRHAESLRITKERRPDLLGGAEDGEREERGERGNPSFFSGRSEPSAASGGSSEAEIDFGTERCKRQRSSATIPKS